MLPKLHPIQFPDRCPLCGKQSPGHEAKLVDLLGPLRPVSKQVLRNWPTELAVCQAHVGRIRRARQSDVLAFVGLTLASAALLIYLAGRFEMFAAGWWSWAGVLFAGLILPRAIMVMFERPLFDIRPDDTFVVVHVRSSEYANELSALNQV